MRYFTPYLASTYGSGNYSSSTYANCVTNCATSSGGSGGGSSGGGVLTNTGFDVILAVTLACVIILASLIVRFVRRPAKPVAANTTDKAQTDSDN